MARRVSSRWPGCCSGGIQGILRDRGATGAVRTAAAWSSVAKPTWRSSAHWFSVMTVPFLADPAVEVLPVRFAELAPQHLARRVPGQRFGPLDAGRALVVGQPLTAEADSLARRE